MQPSLTVRPHPSPSDHANYSIGKNGQQKGDQMNGNGMTYDTMRRSVSSSGGTAGPESSLAGAGAGAGDIALYDDFIDNLARDDPAQRWPSEKEAVRVLYSSSSESHANVV